MSTTTDLSTLKINYLTKSQYDTAKAQGLIESNEIYMTPEDSLLRSKVGAIVAYAGSDEPQGWLKCDGRAVSRIDYAELYEVIGTTYGSGDGSTTFNIPNLENRVIVGAGDDYNLNDTGGEATHVLTENELPHQQGAFQSRQFETYNILDTYSTTNNVFLATANGGDQWGNNITGAGTATNKNLLISYDNRGQNKAHENMPPYIAINFLICYENHSIGGSGSGGPVDSTDEPTATKIAEFDSDAHMNSTDMTAQDITNFVNGLNFSGVGMLNFERASEQLANSNVMTWTAGSAHCIKIDDGLQPHYLVFFAYGINTTQQRTDLAAFRIIAPNNHVLYSINPYFFPCTVNGEWRFAFGNYGDGWITAPGQWNANTGMRISGVGVFYDTGVSV